jgi:hypothetical protein
MRIASRIGAVVGRARLSHEKLYDLLAGQFIKAADIAAIFDFDPYPDHVMRDKRRRRSPAESGIRALTWREWPGASLYFSFRISSPPDLL